MLEEIKVEDLNLDSIKTIKYDWTLITARKGDNTMDVLTASWGAVGNLWNKPIYIAFIRPERYTHQFIEDSQYFSVCVLGKDYQKVLNYIGTTSGRDEDKIKESGLTLVNDTLAPYYEEAETVIICRKIYNDDFKEQGFVDKKIDEEWYKKKNAKHHTMYIGEIVKVLKKKEK